MKKLLLILTLSVLAGFSVQAQDDDKIQDKMREFIQRRLNLSRNEAERFSPVFVRYFREWRQTLKENKEDVLVRQQRIAELRIRYRTEFKEIVGEKRSTEIFRKQEEFIIGLQKMRAEQNRRDDRPNKRFRSVIQK
jgi:outer membrane lipopolysaccharide assembly protein LptE/RlpB